MQECLEKVQFLVKEQSLRGKWRFGITFTLSIKISFVDMHSHFLIQGGGARVAQWQSARLEFPP